MAKAKYELIIVFKKEVSEERALEIIQSLGVEYREGMDSSKGKMYFYATSDKYILTFTSLKEKEAFVDKYKALMPEVHEIYEPDWDIQKD